MKKNNLKIMEWNLNYGSSDLAVPPKFVSDYIIDNDVTVLTEVRGNDAMEDMVAGLNCDHFVSDDQGEYSNQIIILAKKKFGLRRITGNLEQNNRKPIPDFLHCTIDAEGKTINILGVRVKITDYADRLKQIKCVRKYAYSLEGPVLILGDFNNGQIRGDADADYAKTRSLYQKMNGTNRPSDLRFYNFHLIKDIMKERFTLKETQGEDNSWGLNLYNDQIIYGFGSRIKNDLAIHSSDMELSSDYSWDYVRNNEQEYIDMMIRNHGRNGNKIDHGYPDHARLMVQVAI